MSALVYELSVDAWDALDADGKREAAGAAFTAASGDAREFGAVALREVGPPERRREVAVATDLLSAVEFVLVPGGTFQPGPDDAAWEKLVAFAERVGAPAQPYGAGTSVHWARSYTEPLVVEPFLCATFPVTSGLAELDTVLSSDVFYRNTRAATLANPSRFLDLLPEEVATASKRHGWEIPSAVQLDWAISGGSRDVYYWGDELPYQEMMAQGPRHALLRLDDPGAAAGWPAVGPFGLRGGLAVPQWCWISAKTREGRVVTVRGGAGYCAPWQGCGEFLWLVNFMIAGATSFEEFVKTHGYRPIIPLNAGAQEREEERLRAAATRF